MYNFKEVEKKVSDFWKKNKIEEKVRKQSKKNKEKYFFVDGPPYATGHIHMGTALNKILKDIVLRSKRMQGMNVFDIPGYDTHGVPIEYEIEKEIGVKTKQDIEKYGVKNFIKKCKEFAEKYIKVMNQEFQDLGVWMDWKNSYITFNNEYIETIWWTFKKAHEKNLLYLGKYPVHVCPRCETAVAYNEIIYRQKEDNSIYVKFPLEKEKNKFLLIWTTTPWTLPGNSAVMVHPDFEYAEIEVSNGKERWIIAKGLVESLMKTFGKEYKIKKVFKGKELEGKKYSNPLAKDLKLKIKKAYEIILSPRYVNLETGTGLVHSAPGHGKEDYDASRKYNMDIISPIEINGNLTKEAGKYSGKKAGIVDEEIINDLKKNGFLVYSEKYSHDYPLCWRCSSSLLMMSVPQWFFRISKIHSKLLKENEKINWIPSWAKERMKAWLEGLGDWPISRQRYWGTPLPIWVCENCEKNKVIESAKELEKLSGRKLKDLHKPEIDEVEIKCSSCKGKMKRIPEVLDVWFDSGVASWAVLDYPKNKKNFSKFWPSDFNIEGTDQIRGWWNSELILSVIVFDKKPFDTIYMHGMVLDIDKKKMSKSLGNIISPQEVIEKQGRDALRYYMSLMNPGENISYKEDYFKEIKKFFNVLLNISNLVENEYGLKFAEKSKTRNVEDKWIISRLNSLVKDVLENYNKYLFHKNTELISKFVLEDVSRTYIQITRERINAKDKVVGEILNNVLSSVLLLSAPIMPYLCEHLYQKTNGKKESIHFYNFSKPDKKKIDETLEKEFGDVLRVIELGLAERDKLKIGLKWPLAKATLYVKEKTQYKRLEDIIKNQLNIKELEIKSPVLKSDESYVEHIKLDTKLTPELEAEGYARELSRKIQAFRKKLGLERKDKIELFVFTEEEFKKILEKQKEFIKERTNSKKFEIIDKNVTTHKERFKNTSDFHIKVKRGKIAINKITTNK